MTLRSSAKEICVRQHIVGYIDGELSMAEKSDLEAHIGVCPDCAKELTDQKNLMLALDFALVRDESNFELPNDFTRVLVVKAESDVSGLRHSKERVIALFICAALVLLVLLGLGNETGNVVGTIENFGQQFWAVGGFVFKLIHDISIGTAIILRYLSHRVFLSPLLFLGILFVFSTLAIFVLSRFLSRPGQAIKREGGVFFSR